MHKTYGEKMLQFGKKIGAAAATPLNDFIMFLLSSCYPLAECQGKL
jgi:hypothetical protein